MATKRAIQLLPQSLRTPSLALRTAPSSRAWLPVLQKSSVTRLSSVRWKSDPAHPNSERVRDALGNPFGSSDGDFEQSPEMLKGKGVMKEPQGKGVDSETNENAPSKEWKFEDIQDLLTHPNTNTLLIDVREPSEYSANTIPTAINIPITSHPDAFFLSPEDFREQLGWQKPPLEEECIFFCKAGVRSRTAAAIAKKAGYKRVGEYYGSFMDWEKRGGATTRDGPGTADEGVDLPAKGTMDEYEVNPHEKTPNDGKW